MRIATVIFVVWLLIGVGAAAQRGYLHHRDGNCTGLATVAVTVVAGPLNYLGVNPKLDCTVPQPSK